MSAELKAVLELVTADRDSVAKNWVSICAALDAIPQGPTLDAAIASVDAVCDGTWVPGRRPPQPWMDTILGGGREPRMAVARYVHADRVDEETLERLMSAPELAHIEWLTLMQAARGFKPKFMRAFSRSEGLRNVRHLALRAVPITHTGLGHLCRCEHLGAVTTLVVSSASLKARAGRVLAKTRALPSVQELTLSMNSLTDEGVGELCEGQFDGLTQLGLSENQLTSAAVRHLAGNDFAALEDLDVHGNDLRDGFAESISGAPWLTRLGALNLSSTRLEVGGLSEILGALQDSSVDTLALDNNYKLGGKGAGERIAASVAGRRLRRLGLSHCGADDADVMALAAGDFAALEELKLSYGTMTDRGARALLESPLLPRLRLLSVPRTISPELQEGLESAMTHEHAYFSAG